MLVNLSIRDVVLIDKLDLAFHEGLCVLTGETGAGKSILLDALGLALGGRAESGACCARAQSRPRWSRRFSTIAEGDEEVTANGSSSTEWRAGGGPA